MRLSSFFFWNKNVSVKCPLPRIRTFIFTYFEQKAICRHYHPEQSLSDKRESYFCCLTDKGCKKKIIKIKMRFKKSLYLALYVFFSVYPQSVKIWPLRYTEIEIEGVIERFATSNYNESKIIFLELNEIKKWLIEKWQTFALGIIFFFFFFLFISHTYFPVFLLLLLLLLYNNNLT